MRPWWISIFHCATARLSHIENMSNFQFNTINSLYSDVLVLWFFPSASTATQIDVSHIHELYALLCLNPNVNNTWNHVYRSEIYLYLFVCVYTHTHCKRISNDSENYFNFLLESHLVCHKGRATGREWETLMRYGDSHPKNNESHSYGSAKMERKSLIRYLSLSLHSANIAMFWVVAFFFSLALFAVYAVQCVYTLS